MIRIEPNTEHFALTNDQFCTIAGIIQRDTSLDYDITEHDEPGTVTQYVYLYMWPEAGYATRYHIGLDGDVLGSECVDWLDPAEGATP